MSAVVRVAAMELRTAVYRAYVAGGASSGEAEAAAEAAVRAELLAGGGVRLAVDGIARIPRPGVGAGVVDGDPARLVDDADRAPLLALRLGLDWVGATGRALVVPGLTWSEALAAAVDGEAAATPHPDGVLVVPAPAAPAPPPVGADGIDVDAAAWRALDAAAARYLVPEA